MGKKGGPDRHQVEAHFEQFWVDFKGFLGVNQTKRHQEACKPPGYTRGRPLKLLSNLPRDVVGDVRLGSHSAVVTSWSQPLLFSSKMAQFDNFLTF